MASSRSSLLSRRRRQRSVRVTVAVVLLSTATLAVLAALPTQSPVLLSASAVAALVLGWAALRIVWTEVLQSRRDHAADRASTANAYRTLFSERAADHAEFTSVMTERLATSTAEVHELQGALVQAQRKVAELSARAETAESGFASALVRVAELERSIELLRAEQEEAIAEAEALGLIEPGSVDDLMDFDEKIARAAGKHAKAETKLA